MNKQKREMAVNKFLLIWIVLIGILGFVGVVIAEWSGEGYDLKRIFLNLNELKGGIEK